MSSGGWKCRFTVSTSFMYSTKFPTESINSSREVCVLKKLSERFLQRNPKSVKKVGTFTMIAYFEVQTHISPNYRLFFKLKFQSKNYLWKENWLTVQFSEVSISTVRVLRSQKDLILLTCLHNRNHVTPKLSVSFVHRSLKKNFSTLGQDSVETTCIWAFVSEIWWFSSFKKEETSDYVRKSNSFCSVAAVLMSSLKSSTKISNTLKAAFIRKKSSFGSNVWQTNESNLYFWF